MLTSVLIFNQIVVIPSSECVRLGIDSWRYGYVFQSTEVTTNILKNAEEKKDKEKKEKEADYDDGKHLNKNESRDEIELMGNVKMKGIKAAYTSFLPSPYCRPALCSSASSSPSPNTSLPSTSIPSSSSSSSATRLPSDNINDSPLRWLIIEPPSLSRTYVLSPSHHTRHAQPHPNSTANTGSDGNHKQTDIVNGNRQGTTECDQNNENNDYENEDSGGIKENFQIISHPGKIFTCIGEFENYAKDDNPPNLVLNSSSNSIKLGSWKGEIVCPSTAS